MLVKVHALLCIKTQEHILPGQRLFHPDSQYLPQTHFVYYNYSYFDSTCIGYSFKAFKTAGLFDMQC